MVKDLGMKDSCWGVDHFVGYGVSEYGSVKGEEAMMREILARGPITCSFAADDAFMFRYAENANKHEGVYVDRTKKSDEEVDHDISVVGWGVTEGGLKYWIVRNSWGSYWGAGGWFNILRGEDSLRIESDCDWAVPSFEELTLRLDGHTSGDYMVGERRSAISAAVERPVPSTWSWMSWQTTKWRRDRAEMAAESLARSEPGMKQQRAPITTLLTAERSASPRDTRSRFEGGPSILGGMQAPKRRFRDTGLIVAAIVAIALVGVVTVIAVWRGGLPGIAHFKAASNDDANDERDHALK